MSPSDFTDEDIDRDPPSAADRWLEGMPRNHDKISRVMPPSETAGWGTCVSWKGNIVARVPGRKRDEIARAAAMIAAAPRLIQALREKVAALRTALDAEAHAHERDLLRLAQALGFTHEPPSDVDAMVAAVERLRAIIEGSTTSPTREEVDRHFVEHGGRWLVSRVQVRTCVLDETVTMPLALLVVNAGRWVHASIPGTDFGGRWDDDPFRLMEGATWTPLSADGTLCARPTAGGGT